MWRKSKSKYGNKICYVNGVRFHSKKEAKRWIELNLLERAKEITELKRQVTFPLKVGGSHICNYIADFTYYEKVSGIWSKIVDEVKGEITEIARLKLKLFKVLYPDWILKIT